MDIVASPVSSDEPSAERFNDLTKPPPPGNLYAAQYVTTQEDSEHPSELSKPPLLKHVCVSQTAACSLII